MVLRCNCIFAPDWSGWLLVIVGIDRLSDFVDFVFAIEEPFFFFFSLLFVGGNSTRVSAVHLCLLFGDRGSDEKLLAAVRYYQRSQSYCSTGMYM